MSLTIILPIKIISAQNNFGSHLLFGLMAIGGSFLFTNSLWPQLKAPRRIDVNVDRLLLTFHLERMVRISWESISAIQPFWGSKHAVKICYRLAGKKKYFLAHIDLVKNIDKLAVGELIEMLLENAARIERVDLDKFLEINYRGHSAWGKAPDWTIINTAKRRAEANRRKAEVREKVL